MYVIDIVIICLFTLLWFSFKRILNLSPIPYHFIPLLPLSPCPAVFTVQDHLLAFSPGVDGSIFYHFSFMFPQFLIFYLSLPVVVFNFFSDLYQYFIWFHLLLYTANDGNCFQDLMVFILKQILLRTPVGLQQHLRFLPSFSGMVPRFRNEDAHFPGWGHTAALRVFTGFHLSPNQALSCCLPGPCLLQVKFNENKFHSQNHFYLKIKGKAFQATAKMYFIEVHLMRQVPRPQTLSHKPCCRSNPHLCQTKCYLFKRH